MTDTKCYYKLKCKKPPEYWVRKKDSFIPSYWYPLCLKHLKKVIKNTKIKIIALKTERVRKFEHKTFCSRELEQVEFKRWKMFFDWEEIASELKIENPITFEVHRALEKHYQNNYLKIKNRIERKRR